MGIFSKMKEASIRRQSHIETEAMLKEMEENIKRRKLERQQRELEREEKIKNTVKKPIPDLIKKGDNPNNLSIAELSKSESSKYPNWCIIDSNYLVDAWLTIAQAVYYDYTKVYNQRPDRYPLHEMTEDRYKKDHIVSDDYKKEIDWLNYFCLRDFTMTLYGPYDKTTVKDDNTGKIERIVWNHFIFQPILFDDEDYLKILNDYCLETKNISLEKYDSTFSLSTAFMLVNDMMLNGYDYNFKTYSVNEYDLRKILRYRSNPKITLEEFDSLDDYGKQLTFNQAVNAGIKFYPMETGISFKMNEFYDWCKKVCIRAMMNKYGMSKYEAMKDVEITDFRIGVPEGSQYLKEYYQDGDGEYTFSSVSLKHMYKVYYYDSKNNKKILDFVMEKKKEVQYPYEEKNEYYRSINSLKEYNHRLLKNTFIDCKVYNPERVYDNENAGRGGKGGNNDFEISKEDRFNGKYFNKETGSWLPIEEPKKEIKSLDYYCNLAHEYFDITRFLDESKLYERVNEYDISLKGDNPSYNPKNLHEQFDYEHTIINPDDYLEDK